MLLANHSAMVVLLFCAAPATAYIDRSLTLGKIIRDSDQIVVVEVEKVNWQRKAILFKKISDLKGKSDDVVVRHRLADDYSPGEPAEVLDRAQARARAVCFVNGPTALVYMGNGWYVSHRIPDTEWWSIANGRPELGLAYIGSASRLARVLPDILAGKEMVVTTVMHGATARGSFADVVFNRTTQIESCPLQRTRISLKMPDEVYHIGADKRWFVGLGIGDSADIPLLKKQLTDANPLARQEAAETLGLLGTQAKEILPTLRLLLKDEATPVAAHAAVALLRIAGKDEPAIRLLLTLADDKEREIRSLALRLLGSIRPPTEAAVQTIVRGLRAPSEDVQRAAIDALGRLGPAAEPGVAELIKLLADKALCSTVLNALGRIGAKAHIAQQRLAQMLNEKDSIVRRRVAQAMALIGGPMAAKAIPVLAADLKSDDRKAYDAIIYLGLLGEHGKDALPALRDAISFCGGMAAMSIWAIEPTKQFPWQLGYADVDRDCDLWFFAMYVDFLGPRASEAARALVNAGLKSTGDRVPSYALYLLDQQDKVAIPLLLEGCSNSDPQVRKRAVTLFGRMKLNDERVAAVLQRSLKDLDASVGKAAREAVERRSK